MLEKIHESLNKDGAQGLDKTFLNILNTKVLPKN